MTIFDSIRYPIKWPGGQQSLRLQLEALPEEVVQQFRWLLLNPALAMIEPKFWPDWKAARATVGHNSVCMGVASYVVNMQTTIQQDHSIDLLRWLILHYEDDSI